MITSYDENFDYAVVLDNEEAPTKTLRIINANPETGKRFASNLDFQVFVSNMSKNDFLFETYRTDEELEVEARESQSKVIRAMRDNLIAKSDWTHSVDSPLSEERKFAWATYRQALRDISSHEKFPFLEEQDWPVEP